MSRAIFDPALFESRALVFFKKTPGQMRILAHTGLEEILELPFALDKGGDLLLSIPHQQVIVRYDKYCSVWFLLKAFSGKQNFWLAVHGASRTGFSLPDDIFDIEGNEVKKEEEVV